MNDASSNPADEYSLINRFAEFFDDKGWCYHRQTDRPAIDLAFTGESARWQCVALGDPKGHIMVFMSLLPCLVPPNRRPQIAELFSRINWVITHGCFELDLHNGEVRFRTSQSLSSPDVSLDCIGELIYPNLWAVDHHFGVIMNVVYTKTTPSNALVALAAGSKPKPKPTKPSLTLAAKPHRFELN